MTIHLKPFEGSTVTFRYEGSDTLGIEEIFGDDGLIPADLTAEKLVPFLRDWFGRSNMSILRELNIEPEVYVSIDGGAEAEIK